MITKWSVRVPICGSCYKPKLRLALKLGLAVGALLLLGAGAFIRSALFGLPLELVLQGEGFTLLAASGILYFTLVPKPPVKMKTPPPQVTFWFENPRYGEMFSAANKGVIC